jgi:hypothetical protein
MRAAAQSLPSTPPDQLALQLVEGNSYYLDPEDPPQDIYTVRGSVPNPEITSMSEVNKRQFAESGMIDQFVRSASFMPDFVNSALLSGGPSDLVLQVRVITFPSEGQAADYVNGAFANKNEELRDAQSTELLTDLQDVPWNDEAVSGYTMPQVATDTATGMNVEYLMVNYAGQQGQIVIMARVSAPPDLAELIAREMFYAQMECVQVDAPCGTFTIPVGEFPLTTAIESEHGGGSTSTSLGEDGTASQVEASPVADTGSPQTSTSGSLLGYNYPLETSGNWVLLPQATVSNNVMEAMPMRGTNDNFIVAGVGNLEGRDPVVEVLSFVAPDIGTPTLIENGGTYMLHVVEVNGVTYGIFSTVEVMSSALDSVVQSYIAPLSTFATGLSDLQASVMVNGSPALPGVDGASLVPAFGGTVGDPGADASVPPLIGS